MSYFTFVYLNGAKPGICDSSILINGSFEWLNSLKALLATWPMILMFIFLQKYFVEGIALSGSKG
jgi:ABC-type glycerol-3-phosphate transport system permease component